MVCLCLRPSWEFSFSKIHYPTWNWIAHWPWHVCVSLTLNSHIIQNSENHSSKSILNQLNKTWNHSTFTLPSFCILLIWICPPVAAGEQSPLKAHLVGWSLALLLTEPVCLLRASSEVSLHPKQNIGGLHDWINKTYQKPRRISRRALETQWHKASYLI